MSGRCIFCNSDAGGFKSVEHILPESLGNKEHILPPGIVCDNCNNYFASSIERPVLESGYFVTARFNSLIPNKRAKMPRLPAMLLPDVRRGRYSRGYSAEVTRDKQGEFHMYAEPAAEHEIASDEITRLILPASGEKPTEHLFARFLAKVAVECMVLRLLKNSPELLPEFMHDRQINALARYARVGKTGFLWPYSERRIYRTGHLFHENGEAFEVLHEWTFLYTDKGEMYFVLAILGTEYAMNMGGPDVVGYRVWLRGNGGRSPLYDGC
jgi:hypothetical protein